MKKKKINSLFIIINNDKHKKFKIIKIKDT